MICKLLAADTGGCREEPGITGYDRSSTRAAGIYLRQLIYLILPVPVKWN